MHALKLIVSLREILNLIPQNKEKKRKQNNTKKSVKGEPPIRVVRAEKFECTCIFQMKWFPQTWPPFDRFQEIHSASS